jgi:hypothetical protein
MCKASLPTADIAPLERWLLAESTSVDAAKPILVMAAWLQKRKRQSKGPRSYCLWGGFAKKAGFGCCRQGVRIMRSERSYLGFKSSKMVMQVMISGHL